MVKSIIPEMESSVKKKNVQSTTWKTGSGAEGMAFLCNTLCHISAENAGEELIRETFGLCSKLEQELSCFSDDGDIQRLNVCNGDCKVSDITAELLRMAQWCNYLSGGAFDVTAHKGKQSVKSPFDIAGLIIRKRPEVKFDLGGIAKGFIADAAAKQLRENGVQSALLDFGGNIVVIGNSSKQRPWCVGIRSPYGGHDSFFATVDVSDCSVVTSAEYERGKHILDPRTGAPAETNVLSATVISKNSAFADAMSTAFFIGGEALIKSATKLSDRGFESVIVEKTGRVFFTSGLKDVIEFRKN